MDISTEIMYQASLDQNPEFVGIYWMAVKTTGIFCLPTCTARKPKKENVEFFQSIKEVLENGYRPCKICRPLETVLGPPASIQNLIKEITEQPNVKVRDADLIQRNLEPAHIRRWFLKNYGLTFQDFQRQLSLNSAFKKLQNGENVLETAYNSGFESLSGFSEGFKKLFGVSPKNAGTKSTIDLKRISTPLGTMYAAATSAGICLLEFTDRLALELELKELAKMHQAVVILGNNPHIETLEQELELYFEGKLRRFTVPLAPVGTDFQKAVWAVLREIPYAEIWSYKKQAETLGDVKKIRAVANANGLNKISIIIPCHRVIGTNGTLTGYGGGIWRKKKLLDMEKEFAFKNNTEPESE